MSKIFGIDLGTTYSCIAFVDEYGKPTVVTNEDNEPVTPSVVYFETAENVPVGTVAKKSLETDPANVCSTVKRQMGNGDWFFEAHGTQFRAEQISALILKKLAKDASEKLGEEVTDVVITCPAYFGMAEREATKNAGIIAGLNVLSILNEPTAAALSYGLDSNKAETVLIYDLGGGTFDVTIIKVVPGESISVVATGGDHNLGGKDWDETIRGYLADKFAQETNVTDDIYDDPETLGDLELKSENAKKALSKKDKTLTKVVFKGTSATVELSKETFDEITKNLLDSTIDKTREMLVEAEKNGVTSYDKILLVGGSSRMPQVKDRLVSEFPNIPIETFDPDESVAKGAAIYGMNITGYNIDEGGGKTGTTGGDTPAKPTYGVGGGAGGAGGAGPIKINNVISKSFGVELVVDDHGTLKVVNLIKKNKTLPIDTMLPAGTLVDNQTSIEIKVFENEVSDDVVDQSICKFLGEDSIKGLPANLPKGSRVEITFKISEEGTLAVEAFEVTGKNKIFMSFDIKDAMTQEQIDAAIEKMVGLRVF